MNRKKRKRHAGRTSSCPARKMSEMIWAFAGDFIRLGATPDNKQNRLNAACSAWNIACNSSDAHSRSLDQYVEAYKEYNPDSSDEQVSATRSNMEILIQNKLRLFPAVNKQIVGAQITEVAGRDHIQVMSTRLE